MLATTSITLALVGCFARPSFPSSDRLSLLREREHRQTVTLNRDRGTLRFFRRHPWLGRGVLTRGIAWRATRFARAEIRWTMRELRETRTALRPLVRPAVVVRYLSAWTCIHGFEGAWDANTGNGFYGGLQMDYGFMRTYGRWLLEHKGTADRWTPLEQMAVAERAHDSGRGFYPWPNTARACGLL